MSIPSRLSLWASISLSEQKRSEGCDDSGPDTLVAEASRSVFLAATSPEVLVLNRQRQGKQSPAGHSVWS